MAGTSEQIKTKGVRQVLASVEDVRAAVVETTRLATRPLALAPDDTNATI